MAIFISGAGAALREVLKYSAIEEVVVVALDAEVVSPEAQNAAITAHNYALDAEAVSPEDANDAEAVSPETGTAVQDEKGYDGDGSDVSKTDDEKDVSEDVLVIDLITNDDEEEEDTSRGVDEEYLP